MAVWSALLVVALIDGSLTVAFAQSALRGGVLGKNRSSAKRARTESPPAAAPAACLDPAARNASASVTASLPEAADRRLVFERIVLPEAWKTQFWASPEVRALFSLEPKAIADLVPVQAGVRFCRCPACDVDELDDPLTWTPEKPNIVRCKRCGATLPNDKFPAKEKDKPGPPEETVEVLPGIIHRYPYHAVDPTKARYPEERLYIQAKRDYQARLFLTKAALYSAEKYHKQPSASRDPKLAMVAAVIVLRFAQVYPLYAMHLDQPGEPKQFQPADLAPPYRTGYHTGKWEWNGSLDVPVNLLMAYALIADDPAIEAAGKLLGDPRPRRTIERDLFRASAEFVRNQPEEYTEDSLHVYRGMLAVGKLVGDESLAAEAMGRLRGFAERGFYHDGMWRQASLRSHQRVLGLLDGWIDRLLEDPSPPEVDRAAHFKPGRSTVNPILRAMPILGLAEDAGAAILSRIDDKEIEQASWPAPLSTKRRRQPKLLGGAGLARISIGEGADALDLELRGLDSLGEPHFQRLAMRLAVAGSPVLDDLDELPPTVDGFDLATASHNTVVVDGLNQRETPKRAGQPAAGSEILFHAADPDFQVTCFRDPLAYPQSTTRYRHTLIASAGVRLRYAVSIFEVHGGLQHDQFFHAAPGSIGHWAAPIATNPAPASLLVPSVNFLKNARADQGRWFVQAYGFFQPLERGTIDRPTPVLLSPVPLISREEVKQVSTGPNGGASLSPRLKLHLLGDTPVSLISATSPDPSRAKSSSGPIEDESPRPSLILRRYSENGATLNSIFVTLFEPLGEAFPPLLRVGRVDSVKDTLVLYVETTEGAEQIVVNLVPGTLKKVKLIDGSPLSTDGFVVRVRKDTLNLAGGTTAEGLGLKVRQARTAGTIDKVVRQSSAKGLGWFETEAPIPLPEPINGRILQITHGDGTTHCWTLRAIEQIGKRTKLYVQEEPGFRIDPESQVAEYYQFPRVQAPGPHGFRVFSMIH